MISLIFCFLMYYVQNSIFTVKTPYKKLLYLLFDENKYKNWQNSNFLYTKMGVIENIFIEIYYKDPNRKILSHIVLN